MSLSISQKRFLKEFLNLPELLRLVRGLRRITPINAEVPCPVVIRSKTVRVNLVAIPTEWEDVLAKSIRAMTEQSV